MSCNRQLLADKFNLSNVDFSQYAVYDRRDSGSVMFIPIVSLTISVYLSVCLVCVSVCLPIARCPHLIHYRSRTDTGQGAADAGARRVAAGDVAALAGSERGQHLAATLAAWSVSIYLSSVLYVCVPPAVFVYMPTFCPSSLVAMPGNSRSGLVRVNQPRDSALASPASQSLTPAPGLTHGAGSLGHGGSLVLGGAGGSDTARPSISRQVSTDYNDSGTCHSGP